MNAFLASIESKLDFRFPMMARFNVIWYFATREVEVKHRGCSVLEGFADKWDFPSVFFDRFRAQPSFPREKLAELYMFVFNSGLGERRMHINVAQNLWILIFNALKKRLKVRTRPEGYHGIRQQRNCYLTLWKTMVVGCRQEWEQLPWMSWSDG